MLILRYMVCAEPDCDKRAKMELLARTVTDEAVVGRFCKEHGESQKAAIELTGDWSAAGVVEPPCVCDTEGWQNCKVHETEADAAAAVTP